MRYDAMHACETAYNVPTFTGRHNGGDCHYLPEIAVNLSSAKLVYIGHLSPNPQWQMAPHSHTRHELIVPVRGRMHLTWSGGSCWAGVGDALLYPAGMRHAERADPADPVESYFVQFAAPGLRETRLLRSRDDSGRLRQVIRWLENDRRSRDPFALLERDALLDAALAQFFREDLGPDPDLVQRLRLYAKERLGQRLTLNDLAREARLSRHYLVRLYNRLAGRTPMRDVRDLRLERARDLLVTTTLPLKEIAARTGLGDQFAFSRAFRARFQCPPGRFRHHPTP